MVSNKISPNDACKGIIFLLTFIMMSKNIQQQYIRHIMLFFTDDAHVTSYQSAYCIIWNILYCSCHRDEVV